MNDTNLDWDDLRLFLAVARAGGLHPAAAMTGKSPPTLGRRMLALEKRLGAELFIRTARGYALTRQGEELEHRISTLEAQISPIAEPSHTKPAVKISAGAWMAHLLCLNASQLLDSNPNATLRFIAADERLDIARREAVIGIRNARPLQTGLAAKRVGRVEFAVVSLDETPKPWAKVLANTPSALWVMDNITSNECIEVTHPRNALDLVLAGAADAILPTFIADLHPHLIRRNQDLSPLAHDQWVVSHHEDRFAAPVRDTMNRLYRYLEQLHRPNPNHSA